MHDGTKQRWLFERCPGIAPASSKRLGAECWPNINFSSFAALLQRCCRCCFLLWHAQKPTQVMTPAAIALKAADGMGVKPFCFGHFCQETSTALIPIAYHDWPVGRRWVLYALFSFRPLSPDLCCCLSPPKTLRRRGPPECGRTWPWRWSC